jgi:DNA topoisomerase-1
MVSMEEKWWLRGGRPGRFRYTGANGRPLTSAAVLERIRRLVIPPAWTDVHISPDPERKVQVWGFDAAGRKQYRYATWQVERGSRRKWDRVLHVARALPALREGTNEHLSRPRLDREKVLATVVRLMCRSCFRSGSERYAVANRTFGICTLGKKHVRVSGENLVFEYIGKRRKYQRQVVAATPLVAIIEELLRLRGHRLFQYLNGRGSPQPVRAAQVNRYLRDLLGERCTSKDLRTFGGTLRAATILSDLGPPRTAAEAKRNLVLTCKLVAAELGNTPAICRKAYIHPAVLEQYERHGRVALVERRQRQGRARRGGDSAPQRSRPEAARPDQRAPARRGGDSAPERAPVRKRERRVEAVEPVGFYPEELALMRFLERWA